MMKFPLGLEMIKMLAKNILDLDYTFNIDLNAYWYWRNHQ